MFFTNYLNRLVEYVREVSFRVLDNIGFILGHIIHSDICRCLFDVYRTPNNRYIGPYNDTSETKGKNTRSDRLNQGFIEGNWSSLQVAL